MKIIKLFSITIFIILKLSKLPQSENLKTWFSNLFRKRKIIFEYLIGIYQKRCKLPTNYISQTFFKFKIKKIISIRKN